MEKQRRAQEEAERRQQEEARRQESQRAVSQEAYREKVERLRQQTEDRCAFDATTVQRQLAVCALLFSPAVIIRSLPPLRLRRLREQEEEQRLREALHAEQRLRELAVARGRSVPMSQMPSLNGKQGAAPPEGITPRSRPSSVGSSRRGGAAPRQV